MKLKLGNIFKTVVAGVTLYKANEELVKMGVKVVKKQVKKLKKKPVDAQD